MDLAQNTQCRRLGRQPRESRFVKDHVVLHIHSNVAREAVLRIASLVRLSLITSQDIGLLGKAAYQFQISGGASVAEVIGRTRRAVSRPKSVIIVSSQEAFCPRGRKDGAFEQSLTRVCPHDRLPGGDLRFA